jgi:hypothetical protein
MRRPATIRPRAGRASSHLHGSPSEGKTRADLEAGLRAEILARAGTGRGADELARAKAQLIAGQIYKLDSMFAQAMEIGQLESAGIPYIEPAHDRKAAGGHCRTGAGGRQEVLSRRATDGRRTRPAALAANAARAVAVRFPPSLRAPFTDEPLQAADRLCACWSAMPLARRSEDRALADDRRRTACCLSRTTACRFSTSRSISLPARRMNRRARRVWLR